MLETVTYQFANFSWAQTSLPSVKTKSLPNYGNYERGGYKFTAGFQSINYWYFSWKMITVLIKEEIVVKKGKCGAEWGDESTSKNKMHTMNKRLRRQCSFIIHNKIFLILLLIFHASLYLFKCFFLILYFIFYSEIALWPISCAQKMLACKDVGGRRAYRESISNTYIIR